MTSKAPRPCTLWGKTFDSIKVASVDWHYWEDGGIEITVKDYIGTTLASKEAEELKDKQIEKNSVLASFKEALLAIASAQRPWLKAEGFAFVEGEVYWVKHKLDRTFTLCMHESGELTPCWSDGSFIRERCALPSFLARNILAFKPVSDSQEAWDAVAHIKVYKESTNDAKETNG